MPKLTTLSIFMAAALMARTAAAANDPFVGEWKLDPAKSHATVQMKVQSAGPNKYAFDLGAGPEVIVADGSDQPGYGGTMLAVSIQGPKAWKVVRKKDGRMLLTANWRLSADGKSLEDDFTGFGSDGSMSHTDFSFTRTEGTAGFEGTWEDSSQPVTTGFTLKFQPYGKGGLSLISPAGGTTKDMTFDGKDYAPTGPGAVSGTTFSAKRISARELDETDKYNGNVLATKAFTLSADGKTLTLTVHAPGKRSADVYVLERQ